MRANVHGVNDVIFDEEDNAQVGFDPHGIDGAAGAD
jgi:hypothetical protein